LCPSPSRNALGKRSHTHQEECDTIELVSSVRTVPYVGDYSGVVLETLPRTESIGRKST
jgi:hypothetical protein